MSDHEDTGGASRARVLVTGGAGFIGSHLIDSLTEPDASITVIDNLSTGSRANLGDRASTIELIDKPLRRGLETIAGQRFDRIYHLAAAVGVDLVLRDPIGAIRANVMETDALLEFAIGAGSPPTLVASSSEVYGKPGASVFSEDDDVLYGPTSVTRWSYAYTKAIDEHLALAYHAQHALPVVVARFFNTVGPRQTGRYGMVLPRFVEAALRAEPLRVFGDGKQTRCFCDVRDVVGVLPRLLDEPSAHGRVFNVGSDDPISIRDLAQLVIRTLGSSSKVELVEYDDAYPDGFEDLRHRKPDLSRLRSCVGFTPAHALVDTIRDLAAQIAPRMETTR